MWLDLIKYLCMWVKLWPIPCPTHTYSTNYQKIHLLLKPTKLDISKTKHEWNLKGNMHLKKVGRHNGRPDIVIRSSVLKIGRPLPTDDLISAPLLAKKSSGTREITLILAYWRHWKKFMHSKSREYLRILVYMCKKV